MFHFYVSDLFGLTGDNPYMTAADYRDKYRQMYASADNKASNKRPSFITVQDIFTARGHCFQSFLINNARLSPVELLTKIKANYDISNYHEKFILLQFNRVRGKESEQDSIKTILKKIPSYSVECIEKAFMINHHGLTFKGRVDMIAINRKGKRRLIEIKRRVNGFRKLSPYEIAQINLYMYFLGFKQGQIIEVVEDRIKRHILKLDLPKVGKIIKNATIFFNNITGCMPMNDALLFQLYDVHRFSVNLKEIFQNIEYFNKFNYNVC